jgi:hypothetical protein
MKHHGTARGLAVLVTWLGALAAALVLFHGVGSGPLAAPPLDPATWGAWLAARDPLVATVAVLRVLVLAATWYLVGATAIGLAARLARSVQAVRVADALTVPALRRLLQAGLGLSLATGVVVSALPAGVAAAGGSSAVVAAAPIAPGQGALPPVLRLIAEGGPDDERPAPPTLRRLDVPGPPLSPRDGSVPVEGTARPSPAQGAGGAPDATPAAGREVVLRHLGPGGRVGEGVAPAAGSPDRLPTAAPATPDDATSPDVATPTGHATAPIAAGAHEHIVVAGESLWTIARDVVAGRLGRSPTDAEVAGYWVELIETQRPFLANPEDPDLIFPGERVRLPIWTGGSGG